MLLPFVRFSRKGSLLNLCLTTALALRCWPWSTIFSLKWSECDMWRAFLISYKDKKEENTPKLPPSAQLWALTNLQGFFMKLASVNSESELIKVLRIREGGVLSPTGSIYIVVTVSKTQRTILERRQKNFNSCKCGERLWKALYMMT